VTRIADITSYFIVTCYH